MPTPSTAATAPSAPATAEQDDLAALVRAFPDGEVSDVGGPASLRAWMHDWLGAIGSRSGKAPIDMAFVLDLTLPEEAASALELSLAANRTALDQRGRFALISSGSVAGAWRARVEAPLGDDLYAVLRALHRVGWTPDGSGAGLAPSLAGLLEATRLDWRAGAGHRHIVLLTDDRPRPNLIRRDALPAVDPSMRTTIAAWARANNATLHAVRCLLEFADGRGTGPEARPDPGVPLEIVAGLFRDGRYTHAESPAALVAAVEDTLARAAPDGVPADVVLAVDRTGLMGEALGALVTARPALDRFVAQPGRRLALIRWGSGAPATAVAFTSKKGAVPAALAALRPGPLRDWPKDVFAALDAARRLPWSSAARKTVLVLTAAPAETGTASSAVLDWTDDLATKVHFVAPAPGARPSGRAP
ncbi:hypothetical protein WMF38_07565 [Sorangium sp. So ce118]